MTRDELVIALGKLDNCQVLLRLTNGSGDMITATKFSVTQDAGCTETDMIIIDGEEEDGYEHP